MKVFKCFHYTGNKETSGGIIEKSPVQENNKKKTSLEIVHRIYSLQDRWICTIPSRARGGREEGARRARGGHEVGAIRARGGREADPRRARVWYKVGTIPALLRMVHFTCSEHFPSLPVPQNSPQLSTQTNFQQHINVLAILEGSI